MRAFGSLLVQLCSLGGGRAGAPGGARAGESRARGLVLVLLLGSWAGGSARADPPPPAKADLPPPKLACLARHYPVRATLEEGRWMAVLPGGARLAYDDGRTKSLDQRLADPDVEDLFAYPYRAGPIRPVTTVDADPGRVRWDVLLSVTYPRSDLTRIELFGRRLRVHSKVAPAFRRVGARLASALARDPSLGPYLEHLGGTFVVRKIAGTDRPSAHSYGISIDLNPARSHYWRWQRPPGPPRWRNRIPQPIVDAFEAEGFIWGGRWYHYDTMHFEYRPELLDPGCS